MEAIRAAIQASQDAGQLQYALGEAEVEVRNAQRHLVKAEENVEDCLSKLNRSADDFTHVREVFSPPPAQPVQHSLAARDKPGSRSTQASKDRVVSPSIPRHADEPELSHVVGSPAPRRPGGVIRSTVQFTPSGDVVQEGSNFPAYIVYYGPNAHRLFTSWRSFPERGIEGAQDWVNSSPGKSYYKGFQSLQLAQQYYD
ncbi:hypothetical protein MPER_07594, partial [Moniliophthora perniciosa FA553]